MQTIKYKTKAPVKSSLTAFMLISFSALSFSATASIRPALFTSAQHLVISGDTVKMTMGVPLKPEDISPLLAGEQIPLLSLPKSSGEMFNLNKSVAETPTILVFYRGGWCPYCSRQLAGLQEIEEDLTKMGYQIIAISTDSPDNLSKTMDKQKLSYTLLSDADLAAAKRFGIAFKSPENYDKFLPETSGGKNVDKLLPVPSVFILNKKGSILFEYTFIENSFSMALKKAKAERKYIFVDAYTTWCGPCKQLKNTTFKDNQVADFFNKNFVNVAIDMEKGEGMDLALKWDVQEYPTLLVLDYNGKVIHRSIGYLNAKQLTSFGKKALQKASGH